MRIPGPALVLPLFLAGCAVPPAVTVATLVLDGVSLVTTGKSPADHAISAVTNEDCALHRVVDEDRAVCDPDGEVLFALAVGDPADENWNVDPETGSVALEEPWGSGNDLQAAVDSRPQPRVQLAAASATPKPRPQSSGTVTALTPDPLGIGRIQSRPQAAPVWAAPEVNLPNTVAEKPSPRGLFAGAQPQPRPRALQLQPQLASQPTPRPASQLTRLTQQDGQVITYAVIGSFQNADNALQMAKSRDEGAFIQQVEVNGKPTYRVLVDQPIEQARHVGFPDAWPVRLCADDSRDASSPCGHFVVSQSGVYFEASNN